MTKKLPLNATVSRSSVYTLVFSWLPETERLHVRVRSRLG